MNGAPAVRRTRKGLAAPPDARPSIPVSGPALALASTGFAAKPPPGRAAGVVRALEHAFDRPFGPELNPLKQLGAVATLLLWLLLASGVVLYAVLDTSAVGAYASIAALADVPWGLGVLLRGLHRYGADAFMVVLALHILREWALGRYTHFRRAIWWTGVPLVLLAFVSAIGGFWLNWDRLGQYSALATAEWIDALPLLSTPLARNFLDGVALGDRLFTLFIFVHLGVPLMLMFGLWFHVQRLSLPRVFPPRPLTLGWLALLSLLSLALPVTSQGPADLARVPQALAYDWVLLFIHPLVDATSASFVWALVALVFFLLMLPPLLPAPARTPVAQVHPAHCSGCERCFDDCPYAAITMVAHDNGKPGARMAQVDADLCASCGICAGSCPSSTPFRSMEQLVTGIDMPQQPVDALRAQLAGRLAALPGPHKFVVFGCAEGVRALPQASDVVQMELICAGMLAPSFVEYALRAGAEGVLVASCREGSCAYRFGQRWTAERLAGVREPHLRRSVDAQRWALAAVDRGDETKLAAALDDLRRRTRAGASAFEEIAT